MAARGIAVARNVGVVGRYPVVRSCIAESESEFGSGERSALFGISSCGLAGLLFGERGRACGEKNPGVCGDQSVEKGVGGCGPSWGDQGALGRLWSENDLRRLDAWR